MSAVPCKKHRIVLPEHAALKVMLDLHVAGVWEPLTPLRPLDTTSYQERRDKVTERETLYQRVLLGFSELPTKMASPKQVLSTENVQQFLAKEEEVTNQVRSVQAMLEQLDSVKKTQDQVAQDIAAIAEFSSLDEPLFQYQGDELVDTKLFFLPNEEKKQLRDDVDDIELIELYEAEEGKEQTAMVMMYATEYRDTVEAFLSERRATLLQLSGVVHADSPSRYLSALQSRQQQLTEEEEQLLAALTEQRSRHLATFQAMADLLQWEKQSIDSLSYLGYKNHFIGIKLFFIGRSEREQLWEAFDHLHEVEYEELQEEHGQAIALVAYGLNNEQLVESVLAEHGAVIVPVESGQQTIHIPLPDHQQKVRSNQELTEALERVRSAHTKDFSAAYELLAAGIEQKKSFTLEGIQEDLLVELDGWCDPEEIQALQDRLITIDPSIEVEELGGDNHPQVRSVLKNNPLFRPFQIITNLMGMPHPSEPDPSVILAFFFVPFFGFALGDAGYGVMMTLGLGYVLATKALKQEMRDALMLMLYCSISTIIFGALTGTWFGATPDEYPPVIGAILEPMMVLNVTDKIIPVLIGCIAIGIFQIVLGLFINMLNSIRNRQILEGLLGPGMWLFLFAAIGVSLGVVAAPLWLLWGAVLIFAYGQGILAVKSWKHSFPIKLLAAPFAGLVANVLNVTGYLSNILSYARLLALGLATGVIGSVVNLIAFMVGDMLPAPVGLVAVALIMVVGHIFNIALNVLGTFINVIRLQLVEFFPHFFEARGTPLVPLQLEVQYTEFSPQVSSGKLVV